MRALRNALGILAVMVVFALFVPPSHAAAPPAPPPTSTVLNAGAVNAIAVTSTSGATALPFGSAIPSSQTVTLLNVGTKTAYFSYGDSGIEASVFNIPLPAGACVAFFANGATYVALVSGMGDTTTVDLVQSNGPMYSC